MKTTLHYQNLDSTMLEYSRVASTGKPDDRFVIRALAQSAGKGRDGNGWHSPTGGLWLSIDLLYSGSVPSFALYIGFCLHNLLHDLFSFSDLTIKWPNDIFLDGAKLAGIICEYIPGEARYIIGIGINTNINIDNVLREYNAAILSDIIGFNVSNSYIMSLLTFLVEKNASLLQAPNSYIAYCNKHLYGIGCSAEVSSLKYIVTGIIKGLADDGSLLMVDVKGCEHAVSYGSLRVSE